MIFHGTSKIKDVLYQVNKMAKVYKGSDLVLS